MSVGATNDLIAVDIDGVSRAHGTENLSDWTASSCVIDFHNLVPAGRDYHVRILRVEFCAEHTIGVTVKLDSIVSHFANQLSCNFIIVIDSLIFASSHKLQSIVAEITGEKCIVLTFH